VINRLVIIGVGLIGGSLALALRNSGACREVIGVEPEVETLQRAQKLGVIDHFVLDACAAVREADIVVLATPVGAIAPVCRSIRGCLDDRTVLTDVGSVKAAVVESVRKGLGYLPKNFVPAHPIAGLESSGVESATANLYQGRRVILTPLPENNLNAFDSVSRMWEQAGASVETMDMLHHDQVLAATSHLPHLLAYTLVTSLARLNEQDEIFRYAASGFRDFTRIASSDPIMWRDICLNNKSPILQMLGHFGEDIDRLKKAIESGDGNQLLSIFQHAKQVRDRTCN